MLRYELGCVLNYSLSEPSTLIFNIAIVSNDYQVIVQEALSSDPDLKREESVNPLHHNRYARLNAFPGNLQISYRAIVELSHYYSDPLTIDEVSVADFPLDTLPYLYPSRYCQRLSATGFMTIFCMSLAAVIP